jgi:peroxiredoxin
VSKGLEPGMTLPDFTLPDENGARHRLSTLQGTDVLVLHLSRGEHCPRERMHHASCCASTSGATSGSPSS